ncbi:hypothetical protein C7S16_5958 [Burkholderia thailandensis]|uniref:Uncharacterized protein n=1 Tax=Burkholderia thailandensis TaxID=57975 RepID=A0AAW9CQG8_BURTH|nr:hypothetical protein [Burkholderia thailandensis]MDW9253255.1 hypothetical protein [Burkholderia thailandensis]
MACSSPQWITAVLPQRRAPLMFSFPYRKASAQAAGARAAAVCRLAA